MSKLPSHMQTPQPSGPPASGFKGVSPQKYGDKPWRARVSRFQNSISIGVYSTKAEALRARLAYEAENFGYTVYRPPSEWDRVERLLGAEGREFRSRQKPRPPTPKT